MCYRRIILFSCHFQNDLIDCIGVSALDDQLTAHSVQCRLKSLDYVCRLPEYPCFIK